jgi:hypothetical protein
MRRFSRSPKKPPPTAAELERRARQEKEWKKQLRREERSWEKAERKYAKAESERVKERVKKEGPIPEWLEGVVEVDGDVAGDKPVAMEGETLIDFEDDLMRFDSREEAKPDEFARSGERERRRGSLGSHGRKASKEAESEWDIFFDRFESLKVLMELY